MKLKAHTKSEYLLMTEPNMNGLWGLDDLIFSAQERGDEEIIFNPPLIVHKDVTKVFTSNPYNYSVTESNNANNMVRVTKISWI
jgi:hypothetical protein